MENEFECTKIKDGLYLGNLTATQDYEFLQINKFSYIVNCSAEIPNYFDNHGIKYLKFKLIKQRTHKLWDENLKKLRKLEKFIQDSEQQSLCCLIFSAAGNNRSLVMLTGFLMSKYRWTLSKTLQYVRSKKIYIGLSEHYIEQLQLLQELLNKEQDKPKLSQGWRGPYITDEQHLISKTYLNSQEMPLEQPPKKQKKEKRVVWQDKVDKERKKEMRENKLRQSDTENYKKVKSTQKFSEEYSNPHNSLSSKILRNDSVESPLKKPLGFKKSKKSQNNVLLAKSDPSRQAKQKNEKRDKFQQFQEGQTNELQKQDINIQECKKKYFSEKELLKLINKNLKLKKERAEKEEEPNSDQQNQNLCQKGVYKLTINNFIAPNINIVNSLAAKSNPDKALKNASKIGKKEEKNVRTQSEKDNLCRTVNESHKGKPEKGSKNKRNTENSPRRRQKRLQKAVSLQFKKNN